MSKKKLREIPNYQLPIIETHCHLDYLKQASMAEVIEQAKAVNVERIITISVSPDNLNNVVELTDRFDNVWGTQGIHPHDAKLFTQDTANQIRQSLNHEKILAVGEIGLDYFYENSEPKQQIAVFEQQLEMAVEMDLPVVIHTREADEDTQAILSNVVKHMNKKGVIHSFTSGKALAEYCLSEGFCLGFNGICTFNKAENVRDIVGMTPLEQLLLETDAPFLTPVPYRGQENAPRYLPFIAERIADVKGIEVEQVLKQCYANSLATFFHQ